MTHTYEDGTRDLGILIHAGCFGPDSTIRLGNAVFLQRELASAGGGMGVSDIWRIALIW